MTGATQVPRWRRLSALFDRAIDLEPDARRALIDTECADDPALGRELEAMLAADAADTLLQGGAGGLVEAGLLDAHDPAVEDTAADLGSHLGQWQLESVLGRGGMGTVYAARRDDRDTHQRAAVKRLHRRWDGSLQAQRFLQERRILAALSHPSLPRMLDHGTDHDARPWFALELVQGESITAWADARQLDLRQRIELFGQVCAAVQHAHEHFVVHRDLKPGNILVDEEGHPKVLDFGVAKRMDDLVGATRTGAFAGFTPEYAAPEQVSGGTISAATDVYALGVVLYQLLTGCVPLTFNADDLHATTQAITTRTAARLDQAITTGTPHEVDARLQQRGMDLKAFRRFVRGDLSRIVQTALAKEPQRRYASVHALASDLERFLQGRTVSVSGDTVAYRARKYVQRNAWGVAMATLAVLVLLAGVAGIAMKTREALAEAARANRQTRLATHETARAEREALRAQREVERMAAANEFLRSVFAGANPTVSGTPNITLEQALDTALAQMETNGDKDPQPLIRVLLAASDSYTALGKEDKALAAVRRALRLQETRLPDSAEDRARVLANLAWMRMNYEPVQSLAWAKEAVRLIKASALPGDSGIVEAESVLAFAQYRNGDAVGALATMRAGRQALRDGGKAEDDGDVITSLSNEAVLLAELKRYDEAIASHRQAIALRTRSLGADSVATLLERVYLANTLKAAGRNREALAEFDAALPGLRQQLGPEHDEVQNFAVARASVLINLGRAAEALEPMRAAHAYARVHPFENRQGEVGTQYAHVLALLDRCSQARGVLDELHRRRIDVPADASPPLAGTRCGR